MELVSDFVVLLQGLSATMTAPTFQSFVTIVTGCSMHHDPLLSSRGKAVMNWGHSWVVLGVLIRFPLWPERVFCLPILFRLYLNEAKARKHRRKCPTLCRARRWAIAPP